MNPDPLSLPDDQDPAHASTARPGRPLRGRSVVDFRPYPTATTRTRRSPANPDRRPARRDHPPTPSTVWFTPSPPSPAAACDGSPTVGTTTAPLAVHDETQPIEPADTVWSIPVLARAVTSFSEPGASVLLLSWPSDTPYGRPVPAAALATVTDLDRRPVLADHWDTSVGPSGVARRVDTADDRADLLITGMPAEHAADHADTVARIAAGALRLGGILVVLTHCDRDGGVLVDPTGPMVAAGQSADLLYLQHIVAVHLPPADLRAYPGSRTQKDENRPAAPASFRRVHSDVLVFAQPHDDRARPAAARP